MSGNPGDYRQGPRGQQHQMSQGQQQHVYRPAQGHYGLQYAPGGQPRMMAAAPSSSGYSHPAHLSNVMANMSLNQHEQNFSFNPHANVFRPTYQPYGQQAQAYNDPAGYDSYYQQQDQGYDYSDQAAAATAYDFHSAPQIPLSANLYAAMMYSQNAALLTEVQVGLEQLIDQPDEFEAWSSAIRDRLVEKSITDDGLKTAAALLIEMATASPTVQYSYARLAAYLCKTVPDFLMKYVLPNLRETHETRLTLDETRLQYLATFFAEFFTHAENSNGHRIEVLATALFEQLQGMLADPVQETFVKCTIQLLKCSGSALEESENGKSKMDAIFDRLKTIREGDSIGETMKRQIDSVKSLRAAQWGMKSNGQSNASNLPSGPLFLGPDGMPLTDEERAFLEENFGRLDSSVSDGDDPDMLADYEEFLATQH
uniref:MIF4G domain-containing protein n=1 Tax=Plectus sambesii TaxID=2011161 RepID=A0A914X313_9BILA